MHFKSLSVALLSLLAATTSAIVIEVFAEPECVGASQPRTNTDDDPWCDFPGDIFLSFKVNAFASHNQTVSFFSEWNCAGQLGPAYVADGTDHRFQLEECISFDKKELGASWSIAPMM